MIELYAILRNNLPLELCITDNANKKSIQALLKHICKKLKNQNSKLIKTFLIQSFHIYYFDQDEFTFIIATKISTRSERLQNYLRVVAEIFYQTYDQRKFHIVLQKIIVINILEQRQINRIQFEPKSISAEEEESFLVQSSILEQTQKFNGIMQKRNQQSKRAYVIISILFALIFCLFLIFVCKKWC